MIRPEFFSWFTNFYCNFLDSRKKFLKLSFLFYPPTLNNICFVEKMIYFWCSVCVFLRVTLLMLIVLSRFLENDEIFEDWIILVLLFVLEVFNPPPPPKQKKKERNLWKWPVKWWFSEKFFFIPTDPKSEKEIPVNQLIT